VPGYPAKGPLACRRTGLAMAGAAEGGGVSYRLVHQASMITSWAMAVSMV